MRYFYVEQQQIVGDIVSFEVDSTGDAISTPDVLEPNETQDLGYVVYETDESGVVINTEYDYDSIDEIKATHPAGEWQNNNW